MGSYTQARRNVRLAGALAGLLLSLGFWFGAAPAEAQLSGDPLSAKEKARLKKGRLVTRPTMQRRGNQHLFGGTAWQVIDLAPDVVWRAVHDVRRYSRMLPRVEKSEEVDHEGSVRTVRIDHDSGPLDISYHVRLQFFDSRRDVFFQLDRKRPGSLDAAYGFIRITPWHGGKTLLSFGVLADVGDGILAGALRAKVHKWMLKVPWTLKKFVEGSGRSRYDS
jgi:carbon monoxide dehydrogenase subunit G